MRRPYRLSLALAVITAVCGCAQTGRMAGAFPFLNNPPPATAGKAEVDSTADEAEDKKPEGDAKKVADSDPPAEKTETKKEEKAEPKKEDAAVAKTDAKPAESKPEETPPAETKPAAETTTADTGSKTVHDAATLALIDEELKLAAPAERDKLFAEWKTLDSAMVQQVIRIRRMVRELDSSSPSAVASATTSSPVLPGTTSPWGVNANTSVPPAIAGDVPAVDRTTLPLNGDQVAQALPTIEPAGHSMLQSTPGVESTAAYGRATLTAASEASATGNAAADATGGLPSGAAASTAAPADGDAWSGQVQQMIAAAETRAEKAGQNFRNADPNGPPVDEATRRRYVESQVQLRLLYLMAGDQARVMQAIPGLEPADQQFWQQVLWGVSSYFDEAAMPNRADRMTQTVEQLRTAVTRLQSEANLQLRNVAFCRKITSFGNFERFERDEYASGQRVLLYAEVLNFKSVPQPSDGLYKTQLKSTVEILRSGQSQPLTKIEFDPTVDLCRSYRQDYFHSYELKIPDELTVGAYVLKLAVEDVQSGKSATYTLNFTVK